MERKKKEMKRTDTQEDREERKRQGDRIEWERERERA